MDLAGLTRNVDTNFTTRFLTNTDDTGRFIVISRRTGRKYFVEPIETAHTPKWGSVDPATDQLMHKKGDGKYRGGIGFSPDKIHMLDRGTSPLHAIDVLDAKYSDKQ